MSSEEFPLVFHFQNFRSVNKSSANALWFLQSLHEYSWKRISKEKYVSLVGVPGPSSSYSFVSVATFLKVPLRYIFYTATRTAELIKPEFYTLCFSLNTNVYSPYPLCSFSFVVAFRECKTRYFESNNLFYSSPKI